MNTLPVPYQSQELAGAEAHFNDCGAASALMVAQAYNLSMSATVDQVFDTMEPSGDNGLSIAQLQNWLAAQGIQNDLLKFPTPDSLFDQLTGHKPVVALIHYAPIVAAKLSQFVNFTGAHYIVLVGMDIDSIFIHDPYHSDGRGTYQPIPIAVMMQCWSQAILDGDNPQYMGIVPKLAIQDLSKPAPVTGKTYTVTQPAIYVRVAASQTAVLFNPPTVAKGVILHLVSSTPTNGYVQVADAVSSTGAKIAIAGGWVWFGYLQ